MTKRCQVTEKATITLSMVPAGNKGAYFRSFTQTYAHLDHKLTVKW